jgi:hypothetical protein
MPDTPTQQMFEKLVAGGKTQKDAAKEAQRRTGVSLVSGKPIKSKQLKFTKQGVTFGQQNTLRSGKQKFGLS